MGEKAQQLKMADQKLAASPTGDRKVDEPILPCQAKPKKTYHHIGVGVSFRQYEITGRTGKLEVPARANAGVKDMEALNKASGSAFVPANASDPNPSPLKLYIPGSSPGHEKDFAAETTTGASRLIVESAVQGYQLDGAANAKLNALMGKSLALHFQRSGILKPSGTGNFKGSFLHAQEKGLHTTEMMGLKLFVYARMELNGKLGIYEVVDGKLNGAALSPEVYEKRKLIRDIQYSDAFCGGMPLIPGVYQIHVLLDSSGGGAFSLTEIHCDGDPIYPE